MLRQFKKAGMIMGACLVICGSCGCGSAEVADPAAQDPVQTEFDPIVDEDDPDEGKGDLITEEETGETTEMADSTYASLYRDQIKQLMDAGQADQFALVKIDEDDTPELVASDSAGSFDHDNAFIYTVSDNKAVLLASAITGVDGASISFCEGKNIILQSGGIAGATDIFSKIENGKLTEVFRAEMIDTLKADADDEEIYTYSINGKDEDRAAYLNALAEFAAQYDPLTRIDYDGLNTVSFMHNEDSGWFEQTGSASFTTAEEISKELENDAK